MSDLPSNLPLDEEDLEQIKNMLGLEELNETHRKHLQFLMRVFMKFVERNAVYDDLWRGDTSGEQAGHLRHKAVRVYSMLTGAKRHSVSKENIIDDAVDAANYAGFVVRKLEGE